MSGYKDLKKRKLYQKIWAREKMLKKRAIEIVPESVVESVVEIIIPSVVEIIIPSVVESVVESIVEIIIPYVVETEEIIESPIVETVEIAEPIVEIIVVSHFNCEECEFKIKRTEYNKSHTKCIECFYPNRIRGKCLIILDKWLWKVGIISNEANERQTLLLPLFDCWWVILRSSIL
jgi:hypothetical protein